MNLMIRTIATSFGLSLLISSCSLSSHPPQGIPVTGSTEVPASPTPFVVTATALAVDHGSALSFDGQDDYVLVPDNPSLDLSNSFTIAAWIYLEEYTGWASILTKGDKPNVNNYAIQQSEPFDPLYHTQFGRLRFSGCVTLPAPLPESETVLSLRKWHFVAMTFNGLQVRFYTDGVPDGSSAVLGPLCTNDKPLFIGVDFPLTTEYWHGSLDELQIWNIPLSDSEVLDLMNGKPLALPSALVGDWNFDEGSGSILHDSSAYANHGQLVGDPTWIHSDAPVQYP